MIIDLSEVMLELGLSSSITEEERAMITMGIKRAEGAVQRYLKYDPVQRERTEYYPQMDFDYQGRQSVWEVEGGSAYLRRLAEAATSELQVQHIPIRSDVTPRVWVDYDGRSDTQLGAFTDEKTEGADFWPNYDGLDSDGNQICRDGIIRSIGAWPTTPNSVKITYTAGYSAAEFRGDSSLVNAVPIWEVVLEEAVLRARKALIWKKKAGVGFLAGPVTTERLGDYSYSIDSSSANKLFGGQWDLMGGSIQKLQDYLNVGFILAS